MSEKVLRNAFSIYYRVIGALIRREFITLTSKKGSGFLMLMFEPLIFTLVVVVVSVYRSENWGRTIPIVAFAFSGFSIMWATRLQIMRSMFSIQIGLPLLYHRYVKATDIILAKGIIISFTTTLSFFIFLPFLIFFDFIDFPENVSLVVWSWILTQWYAFNFALITGAIAALYTIGNKICLVLNVGHAFITGCFYMVYWFSKSIQNVLVLLPMVNACEMMRDGMFGTLCTTHYNIPYIILCNLALTYIGLVFCRKCANISSFKGLNG